jgi:hypothetical protein
LALSAPTLIFNQIRVLDLTELKAKWVEAIDTNTLNDVLAKVATLVT